MKSGLKDKDPAIINELYDKRMKAAIGKQPYDAFNDYQSINDDFTGLRDTTEVSAKVAQLKDSSDVKKEKKTRERLQDETKEYMGNLSKVLSDIHSSENVFPSIGDLEQRLRIHDLTSKVKKDPTSEEGLAAARMLASAFVNLSFYLPNEFLTHKDYKRAILTLTLASEIKENAPGVWYNMACAYARSGNKKKAIEALNRSVDSGWKDANQMATDPDLESIRKEPDFQAALARVK
ncbi:MAG: hypothetical protein C5B54_06255 [Acidobacteria bacterium]|nr:MAG: hypothetical protein C5B54_06255 [Acidobacteriota bacterium]